MLEKYKEIVTKSVLKNLLKTAYACMEYSKIEIVLGNQSCDQDSFIGSHVLAAMEGRIPVVNLNQEIFQCKQDLVEICNIMDISPENLVYLEKEKSEWVFSHKGKKYPVKSKKVTAKIVDFNLPDTDLLLIDNFTVDGIIDHHSITEFNEIHKKVKEIEIELEAGSCCSIIYRRIENKFKKEIEEKKNTPYYNFLLLLTIPIMTDTQCLKKRTHSIDVNAVNTLLSAVNLTIEESMVAMNILKKSKKCENQVPTEIALLMDYKSYNYPEKYQGKTFGISSVKYAYDDWVKRDGSAEWKKKVQDFCQKQKHKFFILNVKAQGKRELYICNPPSMDFIERGIYEGKPVEKREVNGDSEIVVYNVSVDMSRKIVVPIIYDYLEKV